MLDFGNRWWLLTAPLRTRPQPPWSVPVSAPLVNATRHAIELALGGSTSSGDSTLREVVRGLCVDAQRQGLRPEELILLLKMTWRSRPDLSAPRRGETNPVLEHIITVCIEEYYAA